jgi:diguanylate cyclase (GGDEF)-like protein
MDSGIAVLDVLMDQAAMLDSSGKIVATNEAWKRFAIENGGHASSVGASYLATCVPTDEEPEIGAVSLGLSSILSGAQRHFEYEYPCHSPTRRRWFLMRASALPEGGILVLHTDITRRKLAELQSEELANFDALTRVLNRRGFATRVALERSRMRRQGTRLCALLIDCDDFKNINSMYGHAVGDAVLTEISRRLCDAVRPEDAIGRIGGDEFVVLLAETGRAEAQVVAERIRLAIAMSPVAQVVEGAVCCTVSIGSASLGADIDSIDGILRVCRNGLERSKLAGKNQTRNSSNEPTLAERRLLDCKISIAAQSIVCMKTGVVAGHELLARPDASFSGPIDYFRLATEAQMLRKCDVLCLKENAKAALQLPGNGFVHINVYPSTFLELESQDWLDLFPNANLRSRICLELSEQEIVGSPFALSDKVELIRSLGMKLGIDDVGFGRTCLENLVLLEPDVIKIDRLFVRGVQTSFGGARQLKRLVQLASTLGGTIVVEGVEVEEEFQICKQMPQVQYAQGFFWSRPTSVAALSTIHNNSKLT